MKREYSLKVKKDLPDQNLIDVDIHAWGGDEGTIFISPLLRDIIQIRVDEALALQEDYLWDVFDNMKTERDG